MSLYHEDIPAACPPLDAAYIDGQLYKAINGKQVKDEDFLSFAEQNREGTDVESCQAWGLSVWPTLGAVNHALKTYKFFRKKRIIKFTVTPSDGCLLSTPSVPQPEHHTFWKYKDTNLLNTCEIVIFPSGEA